ncbi:MAG: N-acetyl-gamma-glutamyl-phosphate reductase, partial [Pseudomonadota bacterium]
MSARVPAVVLGASGYVGAELLRLLARHPGFDICAAVSRDPGDATPAEHYPHLAATLGDLAYSSIDAVAQRLGDTADVAVFSAAPHGVSAAMVAALLDGGGAGWRVVDASADFRFADRTAYESIYATEHGAPALLDRFTCAVPEHLAGTPSQHVAHPGCFATAMLLGIVPLLREGLVAGPVYAAGITGSTGSGKSPLPTTHHPERHSNLYAYKPLTHRHAPEVRALCEAATGQRPALNFVPHSGPFARGIHMTLQAALARPVDGGEIREM